MPCRRPQPAFSSNCVVNLDVRLIRLSEILGLVWYRYSQYIPWATFITPPVKGDSRPAEAPNHVPREAALQQWGNG
jgi:hypothetical protein